MAVLVVLLLLVLGGLPGLGPQMHAAGFFGPPGGSFIPAPSTPTGMPARGGNDAPLFAGGVRQETQENCDPNLRNDLAAGL